MANRYDLNINFGYRIPLKYRRMLPRGQWVVGHVVDIRLRVTNQSDSTFPGCKIEPTITEHGMYPVSNQMAWGITEELNIPRLESGNSYMMPYFKFTPMVEGLVEIVLEVDEPDNSEVWVTGWRQITPERRTLTHYYNAVRWQELEIINLLGQDK